MRIRKDNHAEFYAFLAFFITGFFLHFCNYDNSVFALDEYTEGFFAQNNIYFYEPCETTSGGSGDVKISGNTAEEKVWSGLTSFLSEEQAAGVMGNLNHESGLNPIRRQGDNTGFNMWSNDASSGWALGLVQWDGTRRPGMLNYVKGKDASLINLFDASEYASSADDFISKAGHDKANKLYAYEIEFLKSELDKSYKEIYNKKSPQDAATYFCEKVERPAECSDSRATKAQEYYDKFAGKTIVDGESGSLPACSGQGNLDISQTALDLAWPKGTSSSKWKYPGGSATDAYIKAAKEVGVKEEGISATDCGYFVTTVARYSGVDENFEASTLDDYIKEEGSSKWDLIEWEKSDWDKAEQVQPGDIIHCHRAGNKPGDWHQHFYIAAKLDDKLVKVDAGRGQRYGRVYDDFKSASNCEKQYIYRSKNAVSDECDTCAGQGGNGELKDGGYDSAEEAEKAIMPTYKKEANPGELGASRCSTNHDNCVTFSKWFLQKYTGIDASKFLGDGRNIADNFYDTYHDKYPKLTKNSTPSVYSIASWKTAMPNTSSGNHTGVVVGINQATDTILIAEAGWCLPSFTGVHKYRLSDFNGKGVYVNINEYIKSGGLQ